MCFQRKLVLFFILLFPYAYTQIIQGTITNFSNSELTLHRFSGDSVVVVDTIRTNEKGEFLYRLKDSSPNMYKLTLRDNQFFLLIGGERKVKFKTSFTRSLWQNVAWDSLKIKRSPLNKRYKKLYTTMQEWEMAKQALIQIMRLYPIHDAFHPQVVKEYERRYAQLEKLYLRSKKKRNPDIVDKLVLAAYEKNPDWKQPDPWRDSIIVAHYFDVYDPADKVYAQTGVLFDKLEQYAFLNTMTIDPLSKTQRRDLSLSYPATIKYLKKTQSNLDNFEHALRYILKKTKRENNEEYFLKVYDEFLLPKDSEECGDTANDPWKWAREYANKIKKVQLGTQVPNLKLPNGKNLHSYESDYTLLVFWASWCNHCAKEIPILKRVLNEYILPELRNKNKSLTVLAVSLDTNEQTWSSYIQSQGIGDWEHVCDFQKWSGEVPKALNVYATPTYFLLDKEKKIIQKPILPEHMIDFLKNKVQ